MKTFSHSGHRYSTCTIIEHLGRRTFLSTENVFILKHILIPKKHLLKLGTIVIVIVVIVIVAVCYCYYYQMFFIIIVNCLLLLLLSIVCYCYYCQLFVIVIIVKCFLLLLSIVCHYYYCQLFVIVIIVICLLLLLLSNVFFIIVICTTCAVPIQRRQRRLPCTAGRCSLRSWFH